MKLWVQLGLELENMYGGGPWPSTYRIASSRLDAILEEGSHKLAHKEAEFIFNAHKTILKRLPIGVEPEAIEPCCGSSWVDWL
jgi:hypothetical protein